MRPEEIEALRARKAEVLALVRPPSRTWVTLAPAAVHGVVDATPTDHDLAILRFDLLAAMCRLDAEIATGAVRATPMVVRGPALPDWLDLGEVARLFRCARQRPRP